MKIENIKKYPACIPIVAERLFDEWGQKISSGSISNAAPALLDAFINEFEHYFKWLNKLSGGFH